MFGGRPSHCCIDCSQIESLGGAKAEVSNAPTRDAADGGVAVSFQVHRAAAVRAEMKSNAIVSVGVALLDLPLAVEPYLLFRIRRAEVEGSAGAALASLAVAQVDPIRFTCGNYSKRAAVALPRLFHQVLPPPQICPPLWLIFCAAVEPLRTNRLDEHIREVPLLGLTLWRWGVAAENRRGSVRGMLRRTLVELF